MTTTFISRTKKLFSIVDLRDQRRYVLSSNFEIPLRTRNSHEKCDVIAQVAGMKDC